MKTLDNLTKANFPQNPISRGNPSASGRNSSRESFFSIIRGINGDGTGLNSSQTSTNKKAEQEEPALKPKINETEIACVYLLPQLQQQAEICAEEGEPDLNSALVLSQVFSQDPSNESSTLNAGDEKAQKSPGIAKANSSAVLDNLPSQEKLNKEALSIFLPREETTLVKEEGQTLATVRANDEVKPQRVIEGFNIKERIEKQAFAESWQSPGPEILTEEPWEIKEKALVFQDLEGELNPLITSQREAQGFNSQSKQVFELFQKLAQGRAEAGSQEQKVTDKANYEAMPTLSTSLGFKPEVAALAKESSPSLIQEPKTFIQIAEKLPHSLNEGLTSIKIKLSPEGLGEVTVSLICREGKVSLDIVAGMASTQKLLESQAGELRSALQARDYEVSGVNISTNQEQQFEGFAFSRQNYSSQENPSQQSSFYGQGNQEALVIKEAAAMELDFGRRLNYRA